MRGFYGIGIYHPKTEMNVGTLWRHAYLYGADFIFTIGRRYHKESTDTIKAHRHIPLYHYEDYIDFRNHIPYAARVVCIELNGDAVPLPEANHPEQAVYLLGAEDHGLPASITEGKQTIQIPTLAPISMNVAVAGTLVMYDRMIKAGNAG